MPTIDRQIVATLDKLHPSPPCRWLYDALRDTYQCPHHMIKGRDVIDAINRVNYYPLSGKKE